MNYVIAGPFDPEDGTLYWSNCDGWVHLSTATVFTAKEFDNGNGNLPIDPDARWIELPRDITIDSESLELLLHLANRALADPKSGALSNHQRETSRHNATRVIERLQRFVDKHSEDEDDG